MNNHDEYNQDLAAFALDSLNKFEARALTAQIAADPELAREFEVWCEVAAHLACHAAAVEPSPECKDNILLAIKSSQRFNAATVNPENGTQRNSKNLATTASNVIAFPTRAPRRNLLNYAPAVGAIAASIVAVLLGIALYNVTITNQFKDNQIAELNQRLVQTEQRLNRTEAEFEQKVSAVQAQLERRWQTRELLGSPNSFDVQLTSTAGASTAKARIVLDRETGRTMLFIDNLPPAPPGKVYQVWFISNPTNPYPGAVFSTNTAGKAVFRDIMPAESLKASTFAITLEPEGGSPAPTGTILLKNAV